MDIPQLGQLHVCPSTVTVLISRRLFSTNATPSSIAVESSLMSGEFAPNAMLSLIPAPPNKLIGKVTGSKKYLAERIRTDFLDHVEADVPVASLLVLRRAANTHGSASDANAAAKTQDSCG